MPDFNSPDHPTKQTPFQRVENGELKHWSSLLAKDKDIKHVNFISDNELEYEVRNYTVRIKILVTKNK